MSIIIPILLTIILIVYGFVNLALVNQVASPFLAVIFIALVWKIWFMDEKQDILKELKWYLVEQKKDYDEMKKMLEKLLPDEEQGNNFESHSENAAEDNEQK